MVSLRVDLEELLQCPICFDKLAQPKLLPCSHRFCKECIRREMERSATTGPQSSFPCPLCKRTAYLGMGKSSEEWINHFETDHLLEDILEKSEPSGETLCADHHRTIMVVCHDCQILGCVTCALNHHRQCCNVGYIETELVRIKSELSKQLETFERAIKEKLQIRNHLHIISENVEYLTQQRLMFIRSNIRHQTYKDACDEVKQEHRRRMDAIQHVSNMLTDVDVTREMASINEALQTSTLDLLQGQKLLKDNRMLLEETVVRALRKIPGLFALLEHVEEDFITGEHQVHLDYTEEIQNMENLLNDVLAEHKNQLKKGLNTEYCPMIELRKPIKSTAEHNKGQAQSQKGKHGTKMKKGKRKEEYTGKMYPPDSFVGVKAVPIMRTYVNNNKQAYKSMIVFIIICIILYLGILFLFGKVR
ncbi:E3 ubiquitin-protein ligase TRIM39-like [Haliotis rufescens]|uniref:E3 ubiquitin-protein ligase TRIM39-like n=1 Tax=Haliotis rufescens TaxID=6454 RepID=UPI00201FAACA|nr:E3 ubiquitin-protein ligase TRIM39-like [Haliotis rufescens]